MALSRASEASANLLLVGDALHGVGKAAASSTGASLIRLEPELARLLSPSFSPGSLRIPLVRGGWRGALSIHALDLRCSRRCQGSLRTGFSLGNRRRRHHLLHLREEVLVQHLGVLLGRVLVEHKAGSKH